MENTHTPSTSEDYWRVLKWKKKPVVVEAVQLTPDNIHYILKWAGPSAFTDSFVDVYINTLEGKMQASMGDFLIKGVAGEFYPCKEAIFHKLYELEDLTCQ